MATGARQSRFPVNSLGRRGCRGNAWRSPFHVLGQSARDPVGRCRFRKTRVPASVADTHASLVIGGRARCPGVLSKIEFGRIPVTLVIAVEPERGQIL